MEAVLPCSRMKHVVRFCKGRTAGSAAGGLVNLAMMDRKFMDTQAVESKSVLHTCCVGCAWL